MPRTKNSRRASGEGSIFKRESDGLWMAFLSVDTEDGPKKIWVSSKMQKTAKEKLEKLKEQYRRGANLTSTSVTLIERMKHWLEYEIKPRVADATYAKYQHNMTRHIEPTLGKMHIRKIARTDMVEFLAKKESELSIETVKILLSMLRRVIDIALIDDIIFKSPLLGVSRSKKVERKKQQMLTTEEQTILLETARTWSDNQKHNQHVYDIIFLQMSAGLRRSEVLSLKWSDFNFENNTVAIQRVYIMVRGFPQLENRAKSAASHDAIALPEIVVEHFKNLCPPNHDQYVFPAPDENPINPNSFRRTFKRIAAKAGLNPSVRLHDLRHNFASQMVALNVHMEVIKSQMRHADIKTTSRYSHVTSDGQKQAAESINEHLKKIVRPS
ncbi:MAG: tyrosine-type recombinase/integrase [Bacillota bacterium]